jgi:transposase
LGGYDLVLEQGYSSLEVARRLGIASSNVTRWVRLHRQEQEDQNEGGLSRRDVEEENRRLIKENKRLQMEREILKKATAFFAKESN